MSDFLNNPSQQTPPPAVVRTDGMAIASLILGITSFLCCAIPGIVGLILGIVSLNNINRNPARTGKGLAIAGIVTSSVCIFLVIILMITGVFASLTENPEIWQEFYNN